MTILTNRTKEQTNNKVRKQNGAAHTTHRRSRNRGEILPQSEHGKRVSEATYWAQYYEKSDISYEWNNGILEEKPLPNFIRVSMYGWLQLLLHCYLEVNPIAKMLFLEVGFRLPMGEKTTIRKPDLFIIRNDNPIPLLDSDRSYQGICDLCVESVSDSTQEEIDRDTVTKKAEYALVGVKEYYLLDPDEEMAFYRLAADGQYEPIPLDEEGIIHSAVLPGFRFRVADLEWRPPLDQLVEDPVYRDFVLPKYQAEKARAEQEAQRADQEARRAEQEAQRAALEKERAERYAAILRDLGIAVE